MSDIKKTQYDENNLFDRVVSIFEHARGNVVRAINSGMVSAYWLIGREIVQELQGGEERADYGKQIVEDLSRQLTERYGKGYSAKTLWNYRAFYLAYSKRIEILSPAGRELAGNQKISPTGREFSPYLTWSHFLPSEEQLKSEIERERKLIEAALNNTNELDQITWSQETD